LILFAKATAALNKVPQQDLLLVSEQSPLVIYRDRLGDEESVFADVETRVRVLVQLKLFKF
jgi:hypothetical protein